VKVYRAARVLRSNALLAVAKALAQRVERYCVRLVEVTLGGGELAVDLAEPSLGDCRFR
jgi:hypothetical protein